MLKSLSLKGVLTNDVASTLQQLTIITLTVVSLCNY